MKIITKTGEIDSDKITINELNRHYTRDSFGDRVPVYECEYGYADIAQIGENCLCRVSLSNTGIISADCFFELDDCFSFDENLSAFFDELKQTLRDEFEYEIHILPVWTLPYLVNGDASGLTDAEIALVDGYFRDNNIEYVDNSLYYTGSWFSMRNDLDKLGSEVCEVYVRRR